MCNREAGCSQNGAKELNDKLQASEEGALAVICDGADQVFSFLLNAGVNLKNF
jgi:hypothetical protein